MIKEMLLSVILTLLFSVGVGILFVRTVMDMLELLFDRREDGKHPSDVHRQAL